MTLPFRNCCPRTSGNFSIGSDSPVNEALADFGTPMLIGEGYRTFPVLIYNEFMGEVSGDDGFAAAISIIAIIITALIFMAQKHASNKLGRVSATA